MRVLLVEDDAIVAILLAMLVGQLGHVVCAAAASAIEAIDRAAALGPDVVLMDIRLAGQQRHRCCSELYARHALETVVDP
jgi:two-component system, response regulator PdtaR